MVSQRCSENCLHLSGTEHILRVRRVSCVAAWKAPVSLWFVIASANVNGSTHTLSESLRWPNGHWSGQLSPRHSHLPKSSQALPLGRPAGQSVLSEHAQHTGVWCSIIDGQEYYLQVLESFLCTPNCLIRVLAPLCRLGVKNRLEKCRNLAHRPDYVLVWLVGVGIRPNLCRRTVSAGTGRKIQEVGIHACNNKQVP